MSEMIEQVARAIAAAEWNGKPLRSWESLPEDDTSYGTGKAKCRKLAQAAIEAMQKPTRKMCFEGAKAGWAERNVETATATDVWGAMIDVALRA